MENELKFKVKADGEAESLARTVLKEVTMLEQPDATKLIRTAKVMDSEQTGGMKEVWIWF